jgi:hypothetical protein
MQKEEKIIRVVFGRLARWAIFASLRLSPCPSPLKRPGGAGRLQRATYVGTTFLKGLHGSDLWASAGCQHRRHDTTGESSRLESAVDE